MIGMLQVAIILTTIYLLENNLIVIGFKLTSRKVMQYLILEKGITLLE